MQFDLNLLSQFSVTTQINSISAMITYLSGLPVDKPAGKVIFQQKSSSHAEVNIFRADSIKVKFEEFCFVSQARFLTAAYGFFQVPQVPPPKEGEPGNSQGNLPGSSMWRPTPPNSCVTSSTGPSDCCCPGAPAPHCYNRWVCQTSLVICDIILSVQARCYSNLFNIPYKQIFQQE